MRGREELVTIITVINNNKRRKESDEDARRNEADEGLEEVRDLFSFLLLPCLAQKKKKNH